MPRGSIIARYRRSGPLAVAILLSASIIPLPPAQAAPKGRFPARIATDAEKQLCNLDTLRAALPNLNQADVAMCWCIAGLSDKALCQSAAVACQKACEKGATAEPCKACNAGGVIKWPQDWNSCMEIAGNPVKGGWLWTQYIVDSCITPLTPTHGGAWKGDRIRSTIWTIISNSGKK